MSSTLRGGDDGSALTFAGPISRIVTPPVLRGSGADRPGSEDVEEDLCEDDLQENDGCEVYRGATQGPLTRG